MTNEETLLARLNECTRIARAAHQIVEAAMERHAGYAKVGIRQSAALGTAREAQVIRSKYSRLAMAYRENFLSA